MFKKFMVSAILAASMFAANAADDVVQAVRGDWTIKMFSVNKICPSFMKDVEVTGQGKTLKACAIFRASNMDFLIIDEEADMGFIPASDFLPGQPTTEKEVNPRQSPGRT